MTAPEAVHLGLATRIAEDPLDDAMNMANSLANLSPNALREAKNLINFTARNDRSAILQRESDVQDELIGGPDQREAVNAYLEKTRPSVLSRRFPVDFKGAHNGGRFGQVKVQFPVPRLDVAVKGNGGVQVVHQVVVLVHQ